MKKIILMLLLVVSSFANADAPVSGWRDQFGNAPQIYTTTAQGWCNLRAAIVGFPLYVKLFNANEAACYPNANLTGAPNGNLIFYASSVCADGSQPNKSLPLAEQCVPPAPTCTVGVTTRFNDYSGSGPVGSSSATVNAKIGLPITNGVCNVSNVKLEKCWTEPSVRGQDFFCAWEGVNTGVATPAGSVPSDPAATPTLADDKAAESGPKSAGDGKACPPGTVSLGIDSTGGMICGGSGTSPTSPTKTEVKQPATTVTNPDGSTDRVDISHRTNSDGSITTTTKTTTTGADGRVTVKEVPVTGPKPAAAGGGAGVSDAKDEDKTDLCKLHPELNICKNSEVTGGACSGGVDSTACTGDAIQCAILRQQKKEYCENTKDSAIGTLGNQLLAGNDPMKAQIDAAKLGTPFDLGSQSFDQSSFAPSACFGAKSGSVNGHAISIDFSRACSSAANIRLAVLALCSLVGFLIVARSISQV